jgi:membrane protein YdbS with pleckstrin-like domain
MSTRIFSNCYVQEGVLLTRVNPIPKSAVQHVEFSSGVFVSSENKLCMQVDLYMC